MYTEVKMKELLIAIAQGLVEDPTAVNVDVDDSAEDGSIAVSYTHLDVYKRQVASSPQPSCFVIPASSSIRGGTST